MQTKYSTSFKVSLINFAAVTISLLMMLSPLGTKSGAIDQILIPLLLYCVFSFVISIIGITLGLIEKFKSKPVKHVHLGLFLNSTYLSFFVLYIYSAWDDWMGV